MFTAMFWVGSPYCSLPFGVTVPGGKGHKKVPEGRSLDGKKKTANNGIKYPQTGEFRRISEPSTVPLRLVSTLRH